MLALLPTAHEVIHNFPVVIIYRPPRRKAPGDSRAGPSSPPPTQGDDGIEVLI